MTISRIGISQSNYIPWIGYFELISSCDKFVFLESVQYTKNDWRNRNLIRIKDKPHWLTIPVLTKNSINIPINEVRIADPKWFDKHISTLLHSYSDRKTKQNLSELLEIIYTHELRQIQYLSQVNVRIISLILKELRINTELYIYGESDTFDRSSRVLEICKRFNATEYITTTKGKSYLKEDEFKINKIRVSQLDYSKSIGIKLNYESNPLQNLSILDSVAHLGLDVLSEMLRE
jgi:hypothetical protein